MAAPTPDGGPQRDPDGPGRWLWFLGIVVLLLVLAAFFFIPAWWPWSN